MTKPIKNKWEKEFDSMYQHDKSCKPRGSQDSPPWMPCYHFILPSKQREELKSFISTLLSNQKNGSHRIGQWSICGRCGFKKEFKKFILKIGEHGAVGYLTRQGRFCAECGEKIKDTNLK